MEQRKGSLGLISSLSIGTTVPVILVVAIAGFLALIMVSNRIDHVVAGNATHTLGMMENVVKTEVDSAVYNYLRSIAEKGRALMNHFHKQSLRGALSRQEAIEEVRQLFLDPGFGRIGDTGYLAAVSTEGVLSIHPQSAGVDASGFEFMQQALEMKNGYLEYEWKNKGEDKARLKAGYLAHFQPWDLMVWASSYKSEFISLIDMEALDSRVTQLRINDHGYIVLRNTKTDNIAGRDRLSVLNDVPYKKDEHIVRRRDSEVGEIRIDARVLPETGWQIVLVSSLASYNSMLSMFTVIITVAVLVAAVILHLFIRYLLTRRLKPIEAMRALALRIADGDLASRLENLSDDEIGEVGRILNQVIGEFAAVLGKMKSVIDMLSNSIQNLSSSSQEIASTSNEQAAAVKEILSTMEDADQVSKNNLVKVEEVARIANHTRENVEKGFEFIKTSLVKMDEIRTTNSDTISGIKILGERIDSIWEIVNMINSIADQTKIIAFNAELEAAAAGEAGKNFQIVAGEIRRLADGTVNSTREIKDKIHEIQHASDKLIMASEEGTRRISEGWEISTDIRGVFEEVLDSSEVSANSANEITRSTKMQVSSFEQIFVTLQQISESIDSFVESTNYTNQVSDYLKEITDSFEKEVDAYTVAEEDMAEEDMAEDSTGEGLAGSSFQPGPDEDRETGYTSEKPDGWEGEV